MASKIFSRCNVIKTVNKFNHRSAASDGYQSNCKVCCVELRKNWKTNNSEYYKQYARNYYGTNPHVRINKNIHHILNHILKRGSYTCRTEQIIGLNKQTFLEWLSYNFEEEMSWATYGKVWCIDLVTPASAYDLTDELQLLSCFNWKNLRPCLKSANLAKSNFICQFTIANQSIRVLGFIRKLRQLKLEAFLNKF